jgi:hypothetical protein
MLIGAQYPLDSVKTRLQAYDNLSHLPTTTANVCQLQVQLIQRLRSSHIQNRGLPWLLARYASPHQSFSTMLMTRNRCLVAAPQHNPRPNCLLLHIPTLQICPRRLDIPSHWQLAARHCQYPRRISHVFHNRMFWIGRCRRRCDYHNHCLYAHTHNIFLACS